MFCTLFFFCCATDTESSLSSSNETFGPPTTTGLTDSRHSSDPGAETIVDKSQTILSSQEEEVSFLSNLDPLYYQRIDTLETLATYALRPNPNPMVCIALINALNQLIDPNEDPLARAAIQKLETIARQNRKDQPSFALKQANGWSEWDELCDKLIRNENKTTTERRINAFCAAIEEALLASNPIKAYTLLQKCYAYTGKTEEANQISQKLESAYEELTSSVEKLISRIQKA